MRSEAESAGASGEGGGETKPGGPGPEEQKPESELPPDLEQEKREIEARIEQHIAKLQEIAAVFGIDTSKFSDEDDNLLNDKFEATRKEKQKAGPVVFVFIPPESWDQPESDEFYKDVTGRPPFVLPRIIDSVEQDLFYARKLIFTEQENKALRYFWQSYPEYGEGDGFETGVELCYLNMKKSDDPEVRALVMDIRKTKGEEWRPSHEIDLINEAIRLQPELGRDKVMNLANKIHDFPLDSQTHENYIQLHRRIIERLIIVYMQRMGYLAEQAGSQENSSLSLIQDGSNKDRKICQVGDDFKFTEEDARKARELNLPWSRIEKEMGEESAKE